MEVIKPVDFSSFTAFCEHLNKNSTTSVAGNSTAAATITTTTTNTATVKAIAAAAAAVSAAATPPSSTTSTVVTSSPPPPPPSSITTTTALLLSNLTNTTISPIQQQQQTQINGNIYVEKMERQGKMEMAAKERESQRLQSIPKKWNRREEYEFLRVLTGYGIDLQPPNAMLLGTTSNTPIPDWTKFKQMAHLERKSDETLSDYYKVFIAMCKRQAGVKLNENERGLEGIIEDISEDHAKLILDRLELLSKLREISRHPQLEKRLKLCMKNVDTPDWWETGRHDKELITAVLKHGLYRSETFIFNDQTFSFAESEKRFIRELEAQIQRTIKLEAFNAEKASNLMTLTTTATTTTATTTTTPTATDTAVVKSDIIDLDDELLTKSSLIKKEHYAPAPPPTIVKAEKLKELKQEKPIRKRKSDIENTENEEEKVVNEEAEVETVVANDLTKNGAEEKEATAANNESIEKMTIDEQEKENTDKDENEVEKSKDEEIIETETEKMQVDDEKVVEKEKTVEDLTEVEKSNVEEIKESKTEEAKVPESKLNEEAEEAEVVAEVEAKTKAEKETGTEVEMNEKTENTSEKQNETTKETAQEVEKTEEEVVEKEKENENENDAVEQATKLKTEKVEITSNEDESKVDETITKNDSTEITESLKNKKEEIITIDEATLETASAATTISTADPDDEEVMKEKEKAVEEECKKQAAELKARFPDLEVIQPATVKQKLEKPKLEMCMIRWFKDFALERRIAHIVTCVETNKWPVDVSYSAFAGCKGLDLNICLHESIPHLNTIERRSTTPDVITITTDQGVTKHLPASQMQQVAGAAANAVAAATNAAAAVGSGKSGASGGIVALDANSINAAVAAAVAAAASGTPSNALPNLLPGMSMTTANTSNAGNVGTTTAGSTSITPTSGSGATTPTAGKKRKRHIAIDVETERAKLHALLNSSQGMGPKDWETEIANMEALSAVTAGPAGRRSANSSVSPAAAAAAVSSLSNLQPPPAHQHGLSRQNSGQFNKPAIPPLKTPPPSMGAPMDLSSSLPKMNMADMLKSASNVGAIDLSEVQDFSMSSKKASSSSVHAALNSAFPSMGSKSKLDDTLNKLMKKNNCTIEEPVIGKEKKRKKLDEIVLGLSAAKEQKTFPDPSLPSSKKPQIPPSVSVTPANVPSSMSNQSQSNQKPFTITVTTVPGKSKSSSSNSTNMSPSTSSNSNNSGISALQNMTMGGNLSSKDSFNALLQQTMSADPQTFFKQQQKMIQCLPPAQRKMYENMLAEMEQAIKMSAKYSPHDVKVNKWLSDMGAPLNDQLSMEYAGGPSTSASSRRSNRQSSTSQQQPSTSQMSKSSTQSQQMHQQQQQQQSSAVGAQGLTGDEPVPVINKQTGKRLTGNKAPQLKRLMQWLTENPQYEVDPKWLEQMQNPMPAPSPKPAALDTSYGSSSKSHGGRPSSTSSNASSSGGNHTQMQSQSSSGQTSSSGASSSSKKSARQAAIDQTNAAMQFGSLAGLNPNLLASLPGLGAFDPKNPLAAFDPKNALAGLDPKNPLAAFSMPFPGMPGMGNIPGLGNLNNMNLFASLASMGGLGNLASMDAQSLAALMAAAGPALTGLTGATGSGSSGSNTGASNSSKNNSQTSASQSKKNKNNDAAAQLAAANAVLANATGSGSSSSSSSKNAAAASAAQLAAGLPFLFPNPSLLYPPMGLGGLNPYSLGSSGLGSAYDQLAQQYNLLNGGGATSSAGSSSTTQSKAHQSQSKSSSSRSSSSSASTSAAATANLMNAMASMSAGHGMGGSGGGGGSSSSNQSNSQSSTRGSSRQSAASRAQAQASAEMAQLSSLLMPGADPHMLESFSRMAGMDLAQATRLMSSLGMPPMPSSSSDKRSSSSSSASAAAAAAAAAHAAQEKQAAKEQQKWMESLARGVLPTDLAALQAFSQGKLPASLTGSGGGSSSNNNAGGSSSSSSASTSNKNAAKAAAAAAAAQLPQLAGLPPDLSHAFLAEMAAQAMGGQMPSLASLTGLTGPQGLGMGNSGGNSSSSTSVSSSKRQREQEAMAKDAFKQQMDYYTKALGLGSGISLIPTSMASSSGGGSSTTTSMSALDDQHKSSSTSSSSKRARMEAAQAAAAAAAAANLKADEMAVLAAAGFPLNLGGGMTSIEKSLRGNSGSSASVSAAMQPPLSSSTSTSSEADKVTLTPLNSAGIAANLPSQTTITIAPPISSGASSSSERSERSESRISLTITNAADAAKLPPPYEEADELIIQPILKKSSPTSSQVSPSTSAAAAAAVSAASPVAQSSGSTTQTQNNNNNDNNQEATHHTTHDADAHDNSENNSNVASNNTSNTSSTNAAAAAAAAADSENRRSSTRLKRPRSGADHSLISEQPPEKRRELRSTRHTRQSSGNPDTSENDEKE